jgi:hypothetical protein
VHSAPIPLPIHTGIFLGPPGTMVDPEHPIQRTVWLKSQEHLFPNWSRAYDRTESATFRWTIGEQRVSGSAVKPLHQAWPAFDREVRRAQPIEPEIRRAEPAHPADGPADDAPKTTSSPRQETNSAAQTERSGDAKRQTEETSSRPKKQTEPDPTILLKVPRPEN